MKPLLLACSGNERLGGVMRRELDAGAVSFELRRFPDSETYLRIDSDVKDRAVAIVCTLHDPDALLLPLVFMADTLHELGTRQVGLIAPYLAYMRQDQRFRPGEAVTSASFARVLSNAFDWLVTIDPHLHRRQSLAGIYTKPTAVAHAAPLLAGWIRAHVMAPLVIGPDAESEQWVRAVAGAVPCPYLLLEKLRHGDREVTISEIPQQQRWSEHTPVLVDDIISSAQTMAEGVRRCVAAGLRAPVCAGVHGVFAAQAFETLRDAGAARIVTTNSIAHVSNDIDISALLIEPARRFFHLAHIAER